MNNIPKANLEDFTSKNSKTKKLFVKKIGIAFQEIGFLVLKGHFLSSSLQENRFKEIRDFLIYLMRSNHHTKLKTEGVKEVILDLEKRVQLVDWLAI